MAWLLLWTVPAGAQRPVDLRILVDVSGSMKKNDPRNLRGPAVRLLTELLPPSARAGVWTFGTRVRVAVPVAAVDPRWRRNARTASRRFRADELFTDIEAALAIATGDWQEPAAGEDRHLILLTDGMVDVGDGDEHSAASRERIRTEQLPRLKDLGVTVHTVALSANADRELLAALARATDGWFEQVDAAQQLDRVFLRLFEKTATPDTLPLGPDNSFTVDPQVSDMTLLVFRPPQAMTSQVVTPEGAVLSSKLPLPDSVRWQVEEGYDLVTVDGPEPGRWRIDAATDPDNRVMVVTNLQLAVDELPNHVIQDRPLAVVARLLRDGGTVTSKSFLDVVRFEAAAGRAGADPETVTMQPQGEPAEFTATVNPGTGEGTLVVEVVVDGGTFARSHRREIRVHEAPGTIALTGGEGDAPPRIEASLVAGLMDLATARLRYRSLDGGEAEPVTVAPEAPGRWAADLPSGLAGRMMEARLEARRVDGGDYQLAVERLVPGEPPPLPPLPELPEPAPPVVELDWPMVWMWVGGANLLLWPLAGLGWWLWRRQRARRLQAIEEALA